MVLNEIINMEPNESGIITVSVEGEERRFVKEKLVFYLQNNASKSVLKKATITKLKKKPERKFKKIPGAKKEVLVRERLNEHRRMPILAIWPDGKTKSFICLTAATDYFKVNNNAIYHKMNGKKVKKLAGMTFKKIMKNEIDRQL